MQISDLYWTFGFAFVLAWAAAADRKQALHPMFLAALLVGNAVLSVLGWSSVVSTSIQGFFTVLFGVVGSTVVGGLIGYGIGMVIRRARASEPRRRL